MKERATNGSTGKRMNLGALPSRVRFQLFVLLLLLFIGAALAFTVIPLFLLSFEAELGISHTLAGFLYGFLLAGSAIGRFLEGIIVDQFGKMYCILFATFSLILGFFTLPFVHTYLWISLSISVIGIGNGLYIPVGYAIVSELFSQQRGKMLGIYDAMFPVSGLAAYGLNWMRLVLGSVNYALLSIGAFVTITLMLFVIFSQVTPLRFSPGSAASFSLRAYLSRMARVARESPVFLRILAVIVPVGIVTFGLLNFLKVFLVEAKGFPVGTADLMYFLYMAIGIPGKLLAGWLAGRIGTRRTLLWVFGVEAIGLALFTFPSQLSLLFLGFFFVAVTRSGIITVVHTHLLGQLTKEKVDLLYGFFMVIFVLSGSLGTPLTGFLVDVAGFVVGFGILLGFLGLCLSIVVVFIE